MFYQEELKVAYPSWAGIRNYTEPSTDLKTRSFFKVFLKRKSPTPSPPTKNHDNKHYIFICIDRDIYVSIEREREREREPALSFPTLKETPL
jgi:hypothetical protein